MKRRSRLVLLVFLGAIFGLLGSLPGAQSLAHAKPASQDQARWEKHNRKLLALEQKRIKKRNKLERDYQKLLQRSGSFDGQKMLKKQEEFQKKLRKIDEDYYRELQKLERKRL
jgi:hypothetical protein